MGYMVSHYIRPVALVLLEVLNDLFTFVKKTKYPSVTLCLLLFSSLFSRKQMG